ncbi:MAG: hypothetical protein LRY73_18830 [Bacillus sp. (in: Bacteria)]|nr:hypothetical protein [Bacillus sp. (in: firmicutes)]
MLGKSKEIKVKHFDSDGTYIDDEINEWLEDNDVMIIEIKFHQLYGRIHFVTML